MAKQSNPKLQHSYIDAFAGSGHNISKTTGELVAGSPTNALGVRPPFKAYYLIDLSDEKVSALKSACGERSDVHIWGGNCNEILLREVFPKAKFADYRRGLCLLDPYGLHLKWEVIQTAGRMESIDMFLNFPVADINRNVLWRNPEGVDPADIERMNAFWGDDSWRSLAYTKDRNLFGFEEKTDNQTVAEGFAERLKRSAGFAHVATPLPMRNSKGAVVYYLFFASPKLVAQGIVDDIFEKYRSRMA